MKASSAIAICGLLGMNPLIGEETESIEGAQRAFYPACYEYTVGDLILSLPIGFYECAISRLAFARMILETGSPRPVLEQTKYLVLNADALAPRRHFLLLDQHHLLIYSEFFELERGSPPKLQVLQRNDASWSDISEQAIPAWARSPKAVSYAQDYSFVTVTSSNGKTKKRLYWRRGEMGLEK